MNNTNLVNKEKNTKRARLFSRVKKAVACVSAMVTTMMVEVNLALATAGGTTTPTAEQKWDTVIGFIVPWITRLGGKQLFPVNTKTTTKRCIPIGKELSYESICNRRCRTVGSRCDE